MMLPFHFVFIPAGRRQIEKRREKDRRGYERKRPGISRHRRTIGRESGQTEN